VPHFLGNPSPPGIHLVDNHRRGFSARSRSSEFRQQLQHLGQACAQRVLGSNGPQQMLDNAEHDEAEEYADQTIADDGGADCWSEAWQDGFVESDANLVATIGDAWSAEVHPGGHSGAGPEDQPKATDGVHVGKEVDQGDQTHETPDSSTAEAEDSLLVA